MRVAGVDEAGRAPLAGPVVAAAVIIAPDRRIRGLADSKLLRPEQRIGQELERVRADELVVREEQLQVDGRVERRPVRVVERRPRGRVEIGQVLKDLERQMKQAARDLEFEKAASLRDQVIELRRTLALEEQAV